MNRLWIRYALIIGAGVFVSLAAPRGQAQTRARESEVGPSTVVFVCEHGSAKSVVAAAYFNRLAAAKGLSYRAVARGIKPDTAIPPVVQNGLAADGIDASGWTPRALRDQEIRGAGQVISMGTDLRAAKPPVPVQEWNDLPSVSENFAAARAAIQERIQKLLETLRAKESK